MTIDAGRWYLGAALAPGNYMTMPRMKAELFAEAVNGLRGNF